MRHTHCTCVRECVWRRGNEMGVLWLREREGSDVTISSAFSNINRSGWVVSIVSERKKINQPRKRRRIRKNQFQFFLSPFYLVYCARAEQRKQWEGNVRVVRWQEGVASQVHTIVKIIARFYNLSIDHIIQGTYVHTSHHSVWHQFAKKSPSFLFIVTLK